jgi:hypothetical protein
MDEGHRSRPTEAPGARTFYRLAILAMFVIPVVLIAMAAE